MKSWTPVLGASSPLWKAVCLLHCSQGTCQGCLPIKFLPGRTVQWKDHCAWTWKISDSIWHCSWLAPHLWSYTLMFSFFTFKVTSISFSSIIHNGQPYNLEGKVDFSLVSSRVVPWGCSCYLLMFTKSWGVPLSLEHCLELLITVSSIVLRILLTGTVGEVVNDQKWSSLPTAKHRHIPNTKVGRGRKDVLIKMLHNWGE